MINASSNVDAAEIAKFTDMAAQWWDTEGPCRPLHQLNPLRLAFIQQQVPLRAQRILDIGCGGGILTEGLAKAGAQVTGIDLNEKVLEVARQHAQQQSLTITYQLIAAEALAQQQPASFDVITCLELLEHVPDPAAVVHACAQLVKPGGHVFFSTINRSLKAYLLAILGAEYLLNLVPRGTHDYQKLIKPNELANWIRAAGLTLGTLRGVGYQPFTRQFHFTNSIDVNYFAYCRKISA